MNIHFQKNKIFSIFRYLFFLVITGSSLLKISTAAAAPSEPSILNFLKTTASLGGFQVENINSTSLAVTAGQITLIALSFLGVVFVSLAVYAGYLWMTAHGNQTQVDKAKDILSNAVIGLFITFGSYALTTIIHWAIGLGGA